MAGTITLEKNIPFFEFPIEHGIKMPEKRKPRSKRVSKYPLALMQVGDSFFVPKPVANVGVYSYFPRLKPKAFKCRSAVKDGVKGTRVWRTA